MKSISRLLDVVCLMINSVAMGLSAITHNFVFLAVSLVFVLYSATRLLHVEEQKIEE